MPCKIADECLDYKKGSPCDQPCVTRCTGFNKKSEATEQQQVSPSNSTALLHAEQLAEKFHTLYEKHAVEFRYKTRKASAVPWKDVPELNKMLMIRVCKDILEYI